MQAWHWLVDEELIGSKECYDLRPSLARHLASSLPKTTSLRRLQIWFKELIALLQNIATHVLMTLTTMNHERRTTQRYGNHHNNHKHMQEEYTNNLSTPWWWQQVRLGCRRTWDQALGRALQGTWSTQGQYIPLLRTWRSSKKHALQKSLGLRSSLLVYPTTIKSKLSYVVVVLSIIQEGIQKWPILLPPTWKSLCMPVSPRLLVWDAVCLWRFMPTHDNCMWLPPEMTTRRQHGNSSFGSCRASAQPRVCAWRQQDHRQRKGPKGPKSPLAAAPWTSKKRPNQTWESMTLSVIIKMWFKQSLSCTGVIV